MQFNVSLYWTPAKDLDACINSRQWRLNAWYLAGLLLQTNSGLDNPKELETLLY
jgi:hypothetical protein